MTLKGYEVLRSILENGLQQVVQKIIIGRDKNVINDYSKDIEILCIENKIEYFFNNDDNYKVKTDYAIAISWRWLIDSKNLKLIVLHDSILPKYRGFSPLVNMLINGEKKIGVTALFASQEFDKGPIIKQKELNIEYPLKIEKAIKDISILYSNMVNEILRDLLINKDIKSNPQNEINASYSIWRDQEDYFIDWKFSASKICRFIDAVGYPFEGAKCIIDGKVVKIIDCENFEDLKIENRDVGKILFFKNEFPVVVCGTGLIKITNAVYESSGESIFPIKKYRTRFR